MSPEPNSESIRFNNFSNKNNFFDSNQDPDVNFFLDNIPSLNTEYFSPSDVKIGFSKFESSDTFSVLHLNIRSLRKNFEDFKELYKMLNLKFSIVCFSETWADDNKLQNDSLIQLLISHQIRKNRRGGGISIFVHKSLSFKRQQDLDKMCNKSEQHRQKRIFNKTSTESFRLFLREIKWDNLKTSTTQI